MMKLLHILALSFCLIHISYSAYAQIAASRPNEWVDAVVNDKISDTFAAQALQTMNDIPFSRAMDIVQNVQETYNNLPGTGAELRDLQNELTESFTDTISAFDDGLLSFTMTDLLVRPDAGIYSEWVDTRISDIADIRNLTDIASITEAFKHPTMQVELERMVDRLNPDQFTEAFDSIFNVVTDIENLTDRAKEEIMNAIRDVLPPEARAILDLASFFIVGPTGGSSGGSCSFPCGSSNNICKKNCEPVITENHNEIRTHVTTEFGKHQGWLETELLRKQILPAMGMMASQMSAIAMQQVNMIGAFFDAKHQLETQRLFQRLTAEAHEDYQPTEGLCVVGTASRSLNASERKSNLVKNALSQRIMDRQLRSGASVSALDDESDFENRLRQFVQVYCNKADNTNGLGYLCAQGGNNPPRMNKDINFTRTIDTKLTLDIDFVDPPTPLTEEEEEAQEDDPLLATNDNADQEDVMALMANLFAHTPLPPLSPLELAAQDGQPRAMAYRYMDYRSLAAKRSVAQNSFVAMMAERSSGDMEVAPYIKKIVTELGLSPKEAEEVLGERPSYFAQMEVLTKKLYQNPNFYTQLYDKPANVLRKGAAVQAISLMQQRDLFESQLRSEAVIAVMLETMLRDEKRRLDGKLQDINDGVNR